jgi:hypothetical protein
VHALGEQLLSRAGLPKMKILDSTRLNFLAILTASTMAGSDPMMSGKRYFAVRPFLCSLDLICPSSSWILEMLEKVTTAPALPAGTQLKEYVRLPIRTSSPRIFSPPERTERTSICGSARAAGIRSFPVRAP